MVCDIVDSEEEEIPKRRRDGGGMKLSDEILMLKNSAKHTIPIGHRDQRS